MDNVSIIRGTGEQDAADMIDNFLDFLKTEGYHVLAVDPRGYEYPQDSDYYLKKTPWTTDEVKTLLKDEELLDENNGDFLTDVLRNNAIS